MASNFEAKETLPFDTLEQLYNTLDNLTEFPVRGITESVDYVYQGSEINTQKSQLEKMDRDEQPRTIVCHDMKGGYLEDRFISGSTSHDSYVFYHWSIVDTFIYFSHHFVTIPPCGWINAAHDHGVKVLGTVITEWNNNTWDTILASQENMRKFADALIFIAKYYEFEGWLLNIENKIRKEDIDNLTYFVKYLTESIHTEIEDSEIIWYDSVTNKGELKWQNELNNNNKEFFLNCDGIFLNYNWTESRLSSSNILAKELGRDVKDIYVGLDVWGRGCPGGGGFNSAYALNLIRKHGLSAAIFAPGWTHEYFGPSTFHTLEDLFWAQLFPYLYIHVPIYEDQKFKTSFCRGAGIGYYYNGEEYFMPQTAENEETGGRKAFYNLRMQKPQLSVPVPQLQFTQSTKRTFTVDVGNGKDDNVKDNKDNNDKENDKDDKDKDAKNVRTRIECIYENKWDIIRVCDNIVNFESKSPVPNVNTFAFCNQFSYEGGGCLKLITKDQRSYHRLFLIHINFKQEIQATIVYAESEISQDEFSKHPLLVLGKDDDLKLILPYESVRMNTKWKKCIYLTNMKTVHEIGVSFPRECVCYLGEIVLEEKEQRFDNCDPACVASRISDYHVQRSATDQMEYECDDPSRC